MFRLPTPRLLSGLKSALRPAMPRFKVSAFWLLILAWIFLLVWIWWKGPTWTLYEEQWLKPLANRWLATAAWGIIALMWLTVRVMKRLQQLEKMQKQQREEAVDPLSVELNAQQRYLDRWLLRLQRHLDNRRFLWQLPWYMVIGPAGSGKTTLLREGFPSDIIYAPEGARGAEQRLYLTPHVGKQAVIFDIDGTLCAPADADTVCIPTRKITRSAVGCSASLVCQTHCTEEAGMNSNVLTQTIVTGSDPRGLPEFSAIREEINKASHPSQPELNWKLVESLALAIFKANGVDLHTATYYTLARTRTQGLAGFCEGAELLAAMVSHDWDKFWPQGGPARTEMLDWFNSRTGNILRQQISFAESDLPLIYRTERALQLICDKLQQVELKRVPRVENLLYFMQNTRKRLEPQLKSNTENAAQTTVRTLIYAPETQASSTPEAVVPPLPGLPEMKVEVRSLTENPPQASVIKQGSTVRGFIAGIACSVAVASALWWWQVYPVQQQLLQVNDTAQGAATVWMASPELENYERRLQQLLDTSPVQPLETGMQMMRVADSRWPESLQQQQASTQWNEALKTRAQNSPQLRGWLQTRQDLHAFADLVMQREKEGLTLSYIKNVIWQAERGLGQETPVESLLTQYQDARAQKQNTDALEKQINERLEGVLSRWLLLKNNVMPEAATGTTAEK